MNDEQTNQMSASTSQLPPPPRIDAVVSEWIADVREVHRRLQHALEDMQVRGGLAARTRETLQGLRDQLLDCQMRAPSVAMVRSWADTMD